MTLRTLCRYVSSLTRPVRHHSETILHTFTVGVDEHVDPSGEAALAPLKGELLSAARLRGFLAQFTNKPLRFRYRSTTF